MKYELTNDTIEVNGITLYRIRALKDFADVKAGDLGGYVQSEYNLSQEGDCWVFDEAQVFGDAQVYNGATVNGNARVYSNARVLYNSRVAGTAQVSGSAVIKRSYVYGNSIVDGMAVVEGSSIVDSEVGGFAEVIHRTIRGHRIMNTADLVLV